jgi:hypothetical protein
MMRLSILRFLVLLAMPFLLGNALATIPSHAPSLSVHETAFGTVTKEDRKENIEELSIRIVSHAEAGTSYEVQCFFLKQGGPGTSPSIDDTIIFDVVNPHATYKVVAKPIKLKGSSKATKSTKSKNSLAKATTTETPRAGYLVRILARGEVLRESFSNHSVENLVRQNPGLLDAALARKSVRRPDAGDLIQR